VGVIVKPVGIGGIRVCCEPDVDWLINVTSPESTVVLKPRSPTITGSARRYAAKPPNTPLKMLLSSVLLTREISEPSPELTLPSPPASPRYATMCTPSLLAPLPTPTAVGVPNWPLTLLPASKIAGWLVNANVPWKYTVYTAALPLTSVLPKPIVGKASSAVLMLFCSVATSVV